MDVAAEQELEQLEQRMAMGGSPASNYTTNTNNVQQIQTVGGAGGNGNGSGSTAAPESDLDRQLRELEERLNKK